MNMNYALIKAAFEYYGTKEVRGRKANPLIVKWLKRALPWAKSDEIPWCSVFLLQLALEVGADRPFEFVRGSEEDYREAAAALSWRNVGTPVEPQHWSAGDVVIWRKDRTSWQAHVGLFVRANGDKIWLLGGNQDNQVSIKAYGVQYVEKVVRLGASPRGMLGPCSESATG